MHSHIGSIRHSEQPHLATARTIRVAAAGHVAAAAPYSVDGARSGRERVRMGPTQSEAIPAAAVPIVSPTVRVRIRVRRRTTVRVGSFNAERRAHSGG
eukprot:2454022-Prymnesium_polylepis.1